MTLKPVMQRTCARSLQRFCMEEYGSFPKQGDPNKDPKILVLITGIPKKVPLILGNSHIQLRLSTLL